MNRKFLVVIFLAVWAWPALPFAHYPMQALRVSDNKVIDFDGMISDAKNARLIFVGEIHDHKGSHRAQLEVIKRLHRSGVPLAIGMEMFTAKHQYLLDRWVAGDVSKSDFVRFYYSEWNMPWSLYRDILQYARKHQIPLLALNVSRDISRKVATQGFNALTAEERRQLPAGITCQVDPQYMKFIRGAYKDHHSGSEKKFTYFCEAQMLWNKSMGFQIKEYLGRHPQRQLVVLAGAGHVMKSGIPDEVFKSSGYDYKVILPNLEWRKLTTADSDYLVLFD